MTLKVIGLSGSLRQGSFNAMLARAAARLAPAEMDVAVETVHGIPLYDADVEARDGLPARVSVLKDSIAVNFWSGGRLLVSRAQGAFTEDGELANPATQEQVKTS